MRLSSTKLDYTSLKPSGKFRASQRVGGRTINVDEVPQGEDVEWDGGRILGLDGLYLNLSPITF